MHEHDSIVPSQRISIPSSRFDEASGLEALLILERLAIAAEKCSDDVRRIADHLCPPPDALVDTQYLATKLGVTVERISQIVRAGEIPKQCVVDGTGNGKPWKFHRRPTEAWLRSR